MSTEKFSPTQRFQRAYEQGIRRIVGRVLKPILPEQSLEDWLQEIAARSQETDVREASDLLARRMVFWANDRNAKTWREAAAKSQRSRELHRLLQKEMQGVTGEAVRRLVKENARYISSLTLDAAQKLVDEVTKAQQAGARPGTVAKMMRSRFPTLIRSRVHLISRTETAKASTALTQARCEELNLDWYVWKTSDDARVRVSHRKMNDVLCSWNEAPSPEALVGEKSTLGHYAAGSCPNCRCYVSPLLGFQDISWPHRVYHNGFIKQMTLPEFRGIAVGHGIEERVAA